MAESIVELAVGALLPFSQATPASPSPAPTKGFARGGSKRFAGSSAVDGTNQAGMGSTASTSVGVTLATDARSGGVFTRSGRAANAASREFPRDAMISEASVESTAMERGSLNVPDEHDASGAYRGDLGAGNSPLLALDPPSPSSPRRRDNRGESVTPGGLPAGPAAEERRIRRRQGSGVEPDINRSIGGRAAGDEESGNVSGGGGEDAGYVVLVTPTLEQVSLLVAALEAPQVPTMGLVVVCPLYDWNQERDEEEIRRLREFTQVGSRTARLTKYKRSTGEPVPGPCLSLYT